MSRKYIKQINDYNFVYPNNLIYEYDTEIVHDINDNSVSGITNSFTIDSVNATGLTYSYDLTWIKNNAEMYQLMNGDYSLISIHLMPAGELYFSPWKVIKNLSVSSSFTGSTQNFTGTATISNTDLSIPTFITGQYYFQIRFIGHRAIYPICVNLNYSLPTPTPTPSATPGYIPPTPTPTPTPSTTPGGEGISIYVYAKFRNDIAELQYQVNTGPTISLGNVDQINCNYWDVITGLSSGDTITFSCAGTEVVAGSTSSCPNSGFGCQYVYNITTSGYVYLTVDGTFAC